MQARHGFAQTATKWHKASDLEGVRRLPGSLYGDGSGHDLAVRANSEVASVPNDAVTYSSSNPMVLSFSYIARDCPAAAGPGRSEKNCGTKEVMSSTRPSSHFWPLAACAMSLPKPLHTPGAGEKPVKEVASSGGCFS